MKGTPQLKFREVVVCSILTALMIGAFGAGFTLLPVYWANVVIRAITLSALTVPIVSLLWLAFKGRKE